MKPMKQFVNMLLDFFEILFIATAVFGVIYVFVGQLLEVSGNSMYPTFLNNEQIIAEKISMKYKPLQRSDVIILQSPVEPNKLLIKRVIGLPGETLRIQNGSVYINGEKLNEPYLPQNVITEGHEAITENSDFKIPFDSYVVMGDNREESTDSRDWGALKSILVVGRVFMVYYPFNDIRLIPQ